MIYITILWRTPGQDFTTNGYLSDIPLWKFAVWDFESFYGWPRALFSSIFCFGMTTVNDWRTEAAFCPEGVSARSEVSSADWSASLKYKSQLAAAQSQENADCWLTLSLDSDTHMHMHMKMTVSWFDLIYKSWRNDFIMVIIAQNSLLVCDKLCPTCNDWQLCTFSVIIYIHQTFSHLLIPL